MIFWASLDVFAGAVTGGLCRAGKACEALAICPSALLVLTDEPPPSPKRLLAAIAASADGFLGPVDGTGDGDAGIVCDFRARAASETLPVDFLA